MISMRIQALLLDEVCGWVITRKLQTAGVTSKFPQPDCTASLYITIFGGIYKDAHPLKQLGPHVFRTGNIV